MTKISFEKFATNHGRHGHCIACGTCLLDPDPFIQAANPLWCEPCAVRIEQMTPVGVDLPWSNFSGWRMVNGKPTAIL